MLLKSIIIVCATISAWHPGVDIVKWTMGKFFKWIDKARLEDDKLGTSVLFTGKASELVGILERVIIIWLIMMNSPFSFDFPDDSEICGSIPGIK